MKIALAQLKSIKGNVEKNIIKHKALINLAVSEKADLIVFPELSLTSYEPKLAKKLATDLTDSRLDEFQQISDRNDIVIGLGLPIKSIFGIFISMILFQPFQQRIIYSKQKLHADEIPYFIEGDEQLVLAIKKKKIAFGICYESLLPEHVENANGLGAQIYVASVAKAQKGVEKAVAYFPSIAKKYMMPVLMVNTVGFCDDFKSAGQSSAWNEDGTLVGVLDGVGEGILVIDTESLACMKIK